MLQFMHACVLRSSTASNGTNSQEDVNMYNYIYNLNLGVFLHVGVKGGCLGDHIPMPALGHNPMPIHSEDRAGACSYMGKSTLCAHTDTNTHSSANSYRAGPGRLGKCPPLSVGKCCWDACRHQRSPQGRLAASEGCLVQLLP